MQTESSEQQVPNALDRLFLMQQNEESADYNFLEKSSRDSDEFVRMEAAVALGFHYNVRAEGMLIRLADDSDWLVRTEACDSLGRGESEAVLSVLERKIRQDRSALVRAYAIHSYGDAAEALRCDPEDVAAFLESRLPREKSHWTRLALFKVLYRCGREAYLNDLLDGLKLAAFNKRCTAGNNLKEVINAANYRTIRAATLDWLGRESMPAPVEIAVKLIDLTIEAELKERHKKEEAGDAGVQDRRL
ncbi:MULTISPECIES: HEAT repeat domain-containing protein [Saccharibacillus]|uniref:HEAT repeat domain-containing protein n=1 Tax=Saccharibacillus TaxID=456492 RepID=UPI00123913D6|nr:HEAT repeat domain-containing protein [Saccharibacillus sp. WB 17]MWJ31891.1 hypothetical protein [Saccharibacillus sp. WB 17]